MRKAGKIKDWFNDLFKIKTNQDLPPTFDPETLRTRASRFNLIAIHKIWFRPTKPAFEDKVALLNLSVSGVGFKKDSSKNWPVLGEVVEGAFELDDQQYPVRVRIVHQSGPLVGGSFEGGLHEIQRMVMRYFNIELMAVNMVEAHPHVIRKEPGGHSHWFRGRDGTELYFVRDSHDEILRFQFSISENEMEWTPTQGFRYSMNTRSKMQKPDVMNPMDLQLDSTPALTRAMAVRLMENIPALKAEHKSRLVQILNAETESEL